MAQLKFQTSKEQRARKYPQKNLAWVGSPDSSSLQNSPCIFSETILGLMCSRNSLPKNFPRRFLPRTLGQGSSHEGGHWGRSGQDPKDSLRYTSLVTGENYKTPALPMRPAENVLKKKPEKVFDASRTTPIPRTLVLHRMQKSLARTAHLPRVFISGTSSKNTAFLETAFSLETGIFLIYVLGSIKGESSIHSS